MPEITLELIFRHLERVLEEQQKLRADNAEFRAVLEVQSAIIRRLDATVQSAVGEIRALTGQQDRQRQKLERLEKATAE